MLRRCLAASLIWTFAATLSARDFHINNVTGDDRNDGGAPTQVSDRIGPMRSITRALKSAEAGDQIIVANTGEAYREAVVLRGGQHSASEIRPFRLIGNNATLDGTVAVDANAWQHSVGDVFSFKPHLLGHQVLYLQGRPATKVNINSVEELDQLEPLQWAWIDGRIHFCAEKDQLPESYPLAYCGHEVGITLHGVHGVEILDLVVQGYSVDGISVPNDVRDSKIVGSTLRGNGRSGVHVGGASRVEIEACLVGDNGRSQVHFTDYCRVKLANCDLLDVDPNAPPIVADKTARVDDGQ